MDGDIPIPDRPSIPESDPARDRVYTLSIRTASVGGKNALAFLFSTYPPDYQPGVDGPLEMSVLKATSGGRLVIRLDPTWNWRFRAAEPAITLGEAERLTNPPALDRYLNLVLSQDGMEASFHADYLDDPAQFGNVDPYNIYVELAQFMPDGSPTAPLAIKIDPDIRNPGDPP